MIYQVSLRLYQYYDFLTFWRWLFFHPVQSKIVHH